MKRLVINEHRKENGVHTVRREKKRLKGENGSGFGDDEEATVKRACVFACSCSHACVHE